MLKYVKVKYVFFKGKEMDSFKMRLVFPLISHFWTAQIFKNEEEGVPRKLSSAAAQSWAKLPALSAGFTFPACIPAAMTESF